MTGKDIVYENGRIWVLDGGTHYTVMVARMTHTESDSSYEHSEDGLSCAKARMDYLSGRHQQRKSLCAS